MPAVGGPPTDMIPTPEQYFQLSTFELLTAASRGVITFDHRLLHALLDDPQRALPDILRFVESDRGEQTIDISVDLMSLFCAHPVPESVPFFVAEIRRFPHDVPDEVTEAMPRIGRPALEPLLQLYDELAPDDRGELLFLLMTLGVADSRLEALLAATEKKDPEEAAFLREVYEDLPSGDEPPPYDIYRWYPETAEPELEVLPDAVRLEFLASSHAPHRLMGAESFVDEDLDSEVADRLLELAQSDPEESVRSRCWEALGAMVEEPSFARIMRDRITDPSTGIEERIGIATALLDQQPEEEIHEVLLAAYGHTALRARALRAMVKAMDPVRYSPYAVAHLDDPDLAIRRQAVYGIGFFNIYSEAHRLEKLFDHEELRTDALMAYALSAPAETNRVEMRRLYDRMERLAGEFSESDAEAVTAGIDLRLQSHGRQPLFAEPAEPLMPVLEKTGRNDPCPCGSGKKYKKCCGG